jgi:lysophospholipase L1-like esterase
LSGRGSEPPPGRASAGLAVARRIAGILVSAAALSAALDGAVELTALAAGWKSALRASQIALVVVTYVGSLLSAAALIAELCTPPPDGLAGLGRRVFASLTLSWLWFVFVSPLTFSTVTLSVGAGLAAALLGASRLIVGLSAKRIPPRILRALDVVLFTLCATAVLCELSLRAWSRVRPAPITARLSDDPLSALRGRRLAPGSLRFGFPANATGHYDGPFTLERARPHRVAVIGDSFSVGAVPHALHFTTLAEELLGDTELLNLGISGVGPAEYEALLEHEALALAPDLAVVCLFAGNDLGARSLSPGGWMGALATVLDRRNVLINLVPARLSRLIEEREQIGASRVAVSQGAYDVALSADPTPEELAAALPFVVDPLLEEATQARDTFLKLELSRLRDLGLAEEGVYRHLVERCARMRAIARPVQVAFVLIPDEFQVEDALWAELAGLGAEPELERDRFQRELGPELARRGIPVLDLLPVLRAVEPLADGRRHVYHLNDTHFNARGNRAAAEALAPFVRQLMQRVP